MQKRTDEYQTNWSSNIAYSADAVFFPENTHQVQAIVKDERFKHLKVFGTRHCFNKIADTRAQKGRREATAHICLKNMQDILFGECSDGPTVRFGAGMIYSDLIKAVLKEGLAIQNLPSLPHINIVGGMITSTHGSGPQHKILAARVLAMDVVLADGRLVTLSKEHTPNFSSYLLNFGAIGVITSMTILLERKFFVHKAIYENLKWESLFNQSNFEKIMHGPDYLSMFMDWRERRINTVWVGKKYQPGEQPPSKQEEFFGAKHVKGRVHPCPGQNPDACVYPGNGLWNDKIYHFLPDMPPSSCGNEIHSEFFVRVDQLVQALETLNKIRDKFVHLVQITELRMC